MRLNVLAAIVCTVSATFVGAVHADTRGQRLLPAAPTGTTPAAASLGAVPPLVAPDVTVQCPIGLLQQAYDEATTGFQAATRYVTATEVLKLCEEHAKLFKRAIDNETQLLAAYSEMLAAKQNVDGLSAGQGAVPEQATVDAPASAQASADGAVSLTDTEFVLGPVPEQAAEDAAEQVAVAQETSCADPRPSAKFVLANVLGGPGGRDPKANIALYASWDQQAGFRETWIVRPKEFVEPGVQVVDIRRASETLPWIVTIEDCAGSYELPRSTRERDDVDPYQLTYTITDHVTGQVTGSKNTVYNLDN